MNPRNPFWNLGIALVVTATVLALAANDAAGTGKIGVYALNMSPNGADAEDYSRRSWGGAIHGVVPIPQVHNILAGTAGLEISTFKSETVEFRTLSPPVRGRGLKFDRYGLLQKARRRPLCGGVG